MDKFEKQSWLDTYRLLNPDKIEYSWWSQRSGARPPQHRLAYRLFFYRRQAQKMA